MGAGRLQSITNVANAQLSADTALARDILSESQYANGQSSVGLARMEYGNALEKMVAQNIADSPIDRMFFKYVGGKSNPDFVGRNLLSGMNFDITTPGQVAIHLTREGYGLNLNVVTYLRPPNFWTFP